MKGNQARRAARRQARAKKRSANARQQSLRRARELAQRPAIEMTETPEEFIQRYGDHFRALEGSNEQEIGFAPGVLDPAGFRPFAPRRAEPTEPEHIAQLIFEDWPDEEASFQCTCCKVELDVHEPGKNGAYFSFAHPGEACAEFVDFLEAMNAELLECSRENQRELAEEAGDDATLIGVA